MGSCRKTGGGEGRGWNTHPGACQLLGQEAPPCKGASSRHRCVGGWGTMRREKELGFPGVSCGFPQFRLVGRAPPSDF